MENASIKEKYKDKVIFDYTLRQFREDKFSKEVKVLQADLDPFPRGLQAVILSQYRKKLFEKHILFIKPVILFKSKTIKDSREFFEEFIKGIEQLRVQELEQIQANIGSNNILAKAFAYFSKNSISLDNLITELQGDFSMEKCISVDSKSDSEEKQLIVNSLEDRDNEYRAVFAVDKLNEGWDVLNLFDIVRLYNTRDVDSKSGKVGKTTMSEAQLIGRGARYCPFVILEGLSGSQNELEGLSKFQRKYDDNIDNPMRVCEELYYHSTYNPKYISELNKALEEIGMRDGRTKPLPLKLKEEFKASSLYKTGVIYLNKSEKNDRSDIDELSPEIRDKERKVRLSTGSTEVTTVFDDNSNVSPTTKTKVYKFKDFAMPIKRRAIDKLRFYYFNHLKGYFPNLRSIQEFLTKDKYLNDIEIKFLGTEKQVNDPTPEMKLEAAVKMLDEVAKEIQEKSIKHKGSKSFKRHYIRNVFKEKTLNVTVGEGNAEYGVPQSKPKNNDLLIDLSKKNWYAFNENYGTDQEKYLVKYIDQEYDTLKEKYTDIYLLRNERHFKLYNFKDGRAFEPDFVLFLKEKISKRPVIYQLFIEPKGKQAIPLDEWKEKFLKQIEKESKPEKEKESKLEISVEEKSFKLEGVPFYNEEDKSFKLVGMPFYNEEDKKKFTKKIESLLNN